MQSRDCLYFLRSERRDMTMQVMRVITLAICLGNAISAMAGGDLQDALTQAMERDDVSEAHSLLRRDEQVVAQRVPIAALQCSYKMLEMLIAEHPSAVRVQDPDDGTYPLHRACATWGREAEKKISLLLRNGASVYDFDFKHRTALHVAAERRGSNSIVRLLEPANGKAANFQDIHGDTPLHCAARAGNLGVVPCLASSFALKHANLAKDTPITIAVRLGDREMVEALAKEGASLEQAIELAKRLYRDEHPCLRALLDYQWERGCPQPVVSAGCVTRSKRLRKSAI